MRIDHVILGFLLGAALSGPAAASHLRLANNFSGLPSAARPRISAALGRNLSAYWVQESAGALHAADARHRLTADFRAQGVKVRDGTAEWRIRVCSYGYDGALEPVATASPTGSANRIEYRRGPMTEWYVNGPVGLEQGFTITESPGQSRGQPLTIAMAITGNLVAVDHDHEELSLLDREGKVTLRYSGLTAHDTTGKALPAWLELQDKQLVLKVYDDRARYPIVIDPWIQTAELTASDGAADDELGWSVAASDSTVVVGAPFHAFGSHADQGAAYVFAMPGSGWADMTQTAELVASDGAGNDYFGSAVAISGNTIVVGAGGAAVDGDPHRGAAYVFVKPPNGWINMIQTAKLTASDGYVGDDLGASVAISNDYVAVGAPYATIGTNSEQGTAYVFVKPATGWADMTETFKLTASDGAPNDVFGASVALSGRTLVAGASGATIAGNASAGAAYVFVKPTNSMTSATQTAKLTASDTMPDDYFGSSVSVSGDMVAVGAPSDYTGVAYVFVKPVGGWSDMTETAALTSDGGTSQLLLGTSVAISGDTVVAGAVGANDYQGAVFVFQKPASGWANMTQTDQLTSRDGAAGDYFGRSVALGAGTGIGGAPFHQVGSNSGQGAAYIVQALNPRPRISSLSPDHATVGDSGFQLTVNGTNFIQGSVVNWSGSPRSTTYVSPTELQALIPASDISKAGKFKVNVTTPPPGGGTSNGVAFAVNNPVPQIQTLNPDHATVGDPALTLTVTGSNFVQSSRVQANGANLDTTYISSTKVTAIVPSGALNQAGTLQITVVNGAPGGGRSNALTFTVNNPLPALTKLTPSNAKAGGPGFTLNVYGSGFVTSSQVRWKGSARATTYVGRTKVQAKILASDIAQPGTAKVTVSNPAPGGGLSNALTFTINP